MYYYTMLHTVLLIYTIAVYQMGMVAKHFNVIFIIIVLAIISQSRSLSWLQSGGYIINGTHVETISILTDDANAGLLVTK